MNAENLTTIRITVDKSNQLVVEASKVMLPNAIQLCLAAIEAMCKQTLSRTDDPDLKQSLEEDMYEMINMGASTLLNKLFPHIDARPDITVDAIMQAENALLSEKGKEYVDAYAETAQAKKDEYEHTLAKAEIAKQEKAASKKKKKSA